MASRKLLLNRAVRTLCGFTRNESGSGTIETVLWVPVFALIIGLIADTSLIFGRQAEALRVVQDANRALSIGRLLTPEAAEAYVLDAISEISPNATVDTEVVDGIIITRLNMPASDLSATGVFATFDSVTVNITSEFMSEV